MAAEDGCDKAFNSRDALSDQRRNVARALNFVNPHLGRITPVAPLRTPPRAGSGWSAPRAGSCCPRPAPTTGGRPLMRGRAPCPRCCRVAHRDSAISATKFLGNGTGAGDLRVTKAVNISNVRRTLEIHQIDPYACCRLQPRTSVRGPRTGDYRAREFPRFRWFGRRRRGVARPAPARPRRGARRRSAAGQLDHQYPGWAADVKIGSGAILE